MRTTEKEVLIIGAGLAGLSASLRLVERGFKVTLLEQNGYIGGMAGAYKHEGKTRYSALKREPAKGKESIFHEHSYHMFCNWYYNFWQIAEEIGARGNFEPRTTFRFLRSGEYPRTTELVNPAGSSNAWQNLLSGVVPPPDLFLYAYSQVDLLSQRIRRDDFTDYFSVNGFMQSRPYSTSRAAELHQKLLETVWSVPSFDSSAASYKEFLRYGNCVPNPPLWVLKGNKYTCLMEPFLKKLKTYANFKYELFKQVAELVIHNDDGRISHLKGMDVVESPSILPPDKKPEGKPWKKPLEVKGDLLLAVTPNTMRKLAVGEVYRADPKLGDVRFLHSKEMAAIELHFTRKLDLPKDIMVLLGRDAKYEMTFLDYSQMWPDLDHTVLYVTASEYTSLEALKAEKRDKGKLVLNFSRPETAIDYMLHELRRFLPFAERDIDLNQTHLRTNAGAELFANDVGSWQYRPRATTKIPNLFLAGTYCQNHADVATIEGAVVTGLLAAEAIRQKHKAPNPIRIIEPEAYPESYYAILKLMLAPYAFWAKVWATINERAGLEGPEPD